MSIEERGLPIYRIKNELNKKRERERERECSKLSFVEQKGHSGAKVIRRRPRGGRALSSSLLVLFSSVFARVHWC